MGRGPIGRHVRVALRGGSVLEIRRDGLPQEGPRAWWRGQDLGAPEELPRARAHSGAVPAEQRDYLSREHVDGVVGGVGLGLG